MYLRWICKEEEKVEEEVVEKEVEKEKEEEEEEEEEADSYQRCGTPCLGAKGPGVSSRSG